MTPQKAPLHAPQSQIAISDIYYILFKHKWKIITLSLLGFVAAAVIYFKVPAPYESEAKLLVRYVEETQSVPTANGETRVQPVISRGDGIMVSEADILGSVDVAAAAVDAIGVQKFLGKSATVTNREVAAMLLKKNLLVELPKKGNVLRVTYKSEDPAMCQSVLQQVIDSYFKKHIEIHKNPLILDEFLTQQTDQIKSSLTQTEEDLRNIKSKAKIISLDDAHKRYGEQFADVQKQLIAAQVELDERIAALNEWQKLASQTPGSATTNATAAAEVKPKPTPAIISEYKRLLARMSMLQKRQQELLVQFTEDNAAVREVQTKLGEAEQRKSEMEEATPDLIQEQKAMVNQNGQSTDPVRDMRASQLATEQVRVAALQSRVKALQTQFDKLKAEAGVVDEVETSVEALERKKQLQEAQYKYYSTTLQQARFDSQLSAGKLSSINVIQTPSLPARDMLSVRKKAGIAAAAGLFLALGLAFLLELVIDQSVRSSGELEKRFNLPVFLSIPHLNGQLQKNRLALGNKAAPAELTEKADESVAPGSEIDSGAPNVEIAPWEEQHTLHPYSEALRDRLVTFFELKNMTHKPKFVALTSCSTGAGVTTLASGLAASLSETGEGNVLLVDMNFDRGAAHPFYKGKPVCGLDQALQSDNREAALVQHNLYVVHGGVANDRLPKVLPKRFAHLLPKLQASDYDYIIFDMPPISQTSVTPRLAGFMDMVFLVVESEKTSREWLKHATSLLQQSKANIGAVFNKRRSYVPARLHQDF